MIGGDQSRKHRNSALADDKIVEAASKIATPKLQHLQLPPDLSVRRWLEIEGDHAVGNAMKLQVRPVGGSIVQHDHRTFAADKELFQCQQLAAVPQ